VQAQDPIEAIRLHAERLFVIRRGKILAQASPRESSLHLGGEEKRIDFTKAGLG
jgi:cytosine deaminase